MKKTKAIMCPECEGRGYISHVEIWSDENGIGGGNAWSEKCDNCNGVGGLEVPMTNYDIIKNMSIEEMADFIRDIYLDDDILMRVDDAWIFNADIEEWLKTEAIIG